MTCTIEAAGPGHAEVMAALQRACFEEAWAVADFAVFLAGPGNLSALALAADGAPAGFLLARLAGGECEILSLGVLPGQRRGGCAGVLLHDLLRRAGEAGADACLLEVGTANAAALALYFGAGFLEVGRRRGYYERSGGREDALILKLDLASQALRKIRT